MSYTKNNSAATSRRNELARERGFASYSEQRRYDRNVKNSKQLGDLPAGAQQARQDALYAIAVARREGIDLEEASRYAFTTPQSIAYWAPDVVTSTRSGWTIKPADRMYRPMYVYADGRQQAIDVRGSRVASTIGRYHSAIGHYLATGDDSRLQPFTGVTVAGVELETDPDVLDAIARREIFEFESIYRMVS